MQDRPTIKTADLGYTFRPIELYQQCAAIHGAVSWPGKRPGFIVVVGLAMDGTMYLLQEYESQSVRDLVRKCGAFNFKFQAMIWHHKTNVCRWYGNNKNAAACQFIEEMNHKTHNREEMNRNRENLVLDWSSILDMSQPYQFMLDKLGEFLTTDEKSLFLKDSTVKTHLSSIEASEISDMELGEYPAIESVAIAAIELQRTADEIHGQGSYGDHKPVYDNNVLTRRLFPGRR